MGDGSTVAKAMYSHEGPVLTCQWSAVSSVVSCCELDNPLHFYCPEFFANCYRLPLVSLTASHFRMEQNWLLETQIWQEGFLTWQQAKLHSLQSMMHPSRVCAGSMDPTLLLLVVGTRRSG